MTFHIKQRVDGQWYFTVVASNYQTLAHSEGYLSKQSAVNAADVIRREAGGGRIVEG
ncbi:YegP family protein [Lentzea nigeriaca]|uniref:YegP family protein n=1 Tax=Lentzea nigeriaca TaxID=1128665 RepID=UPI00195AC89A|nr:DUF1508 domain-containing protein [Lentzea nigeriaca]MBM7861123.1 uncharacterized protein YegP (UPF0339 family) [Lentzea nigeriaca]